MVSISTPVSSEYFSAIWVQTLSSPPAALPNAKVKLSASAARAAGVAVTVVATARGEREGAHRGDGDERAEAAAAPGRKLGHGGAFLTFARLGRAGEVSTSLQRGRPCDDDHILLPITGGRERPMRDAEHQTGRC